MSLSTTLTALLALAAAGAPLTVQAQARPAAPAGSFLHRQAHSVAQLVQEVETDPISRHRLARYLHIPEGVVAAYIRHNLHASALPGGGDYTVYFVTGSGLVYPTRMALRPGARVFAGRDGRPILLQGTGDPLVAFAPAVETDVIPGGPTVIVGDSREQTVTAAPTDIPVPVAAPAPSAPAVTRSANSAAP